MKPVRQRVAEWRQRQRRGDVLLRSFIVPEASVEALVMAGLLSARDADNPDAIAEALNRLCVTIEREA